jgi:hypothetical protein
MSHPLKSVAELVAEAELLQASQAPTATASAAAISEHFLVVMMRPDSSLSVAENIAAFTRRTAAQSPAVETPVNNDEAARKRDEDCKYVALNSQAVSVFDKVRIDCGLLRAENVLRDAQIPIPSIQNDQPQEPIVHKKRFCPADLGISLKEFSMLLSLNRSNNLKRSLLDGSKDQVQLSVTRLSARKEKKIATEKFLQDDFSYFKIAGVAAPSTDEKINMTNTSLAETFDNINGDTKKHDTLAKVRTYRQIS